MNWRKEDWEDLDDLDPGDRHLVKKANVVTQEMGKSELKQWWWGSEKGQAWRIFRQDSQLRLVFSWH